jgi:hypothetical protein
VVGFFHPEKVVRIVGRKESEGAKHLEVGSNLGSAGAHCDLGLFTARSGLESYLLNESAASACYFPLAPRSLYCSVFLKALL